MLSEAGLSSSFLEALSYDPVRYSIALRWLAEHTELLTIEQQERVTKLNYFLNWNASQRDQWWRLLRRKKELLRRGVKEPDFGKPPELEGIERLLREYTNRLAQVEPGTKSLASRFHPSVIGANSTPPL